MKLHLFYELVSVRSYVYAADALAYTTYILYIIWVFRGTVLVFSTKENETKRVHVITAKYFGKNQLKNFSMHFDVFSSNQWSNYAKLNKSDNFSWTFFLYIFMAVRL